MKYFKYIVFLLIFINFKNTNSQTGPGGVGNSSSNGLWLKADDLTLSNGSNIPTWSDASGNGNNANAASGEQPTLISSSALNGMPAVRLDGISDQMVINDADILDGSGGLTYFAVIRPTNLNGSTPRAILGKRITFNTPTTYAYSWFFWSGNYLNLDINNYNHNRFNSNPTSFTIDNYLLKMGFDGALTTNQANMYSAGSLIAQSNIPEASLTNSPADLVLGGLNYNYPNKFGADYTEVIHYNYHLNTVEQIIVNNYLSAKYNIALTSNDLYTQDDLGNGDFDFNVAGIGRQGSDIHDNSQGSGIVGMHTPSTLSDGDYLFWGEETKDPTYDFSENTSNYTQQLNSRWRVSKVNDLGTVTVAFDLDLVDLSAIDTSCQPMQLMVDNNGDFSSPAIYPLTVAGTTATATGVSFNDADYFTIRYINQIVWDGTQFLYGSGAGDAPDDTDECLKLLIKSGTDVTLSNDAHVKEIEVEASATLNVNDGILLETEEDVVINGVIDLLGEAQLKQNHNTTTSNSGTGYLLKRQQGEGNLYNYNYWSSPVNNGGSWQISQLEDASGPVAFTSSPDSSTSPTTISTEWLYTYKNVSNTYTAWQQVSQTTSLNPGEGFTMKGVPTGSNQEYVFKGIPNDGDYNLTINAGDDFLIGNPYPSALNADLFLDLNTPVIEGTIYFWEHFSSNNSHYLADYEGGYATYNRTMGSPAPAPGSSKSAPTNKIAVGQGFFVTADTGGTITFRNDQRIFTGEDLSTIISETTFLKASGKKAASKVDQRTKIWFAFIEPGNITKTIGLGYDANATTNYDSGYDAVNFDYLRNDISWKLDNKNLVIQALPAINENDELPLEIKVTDTGIYQFAINNMEFVPANMNIYLKNSNLNTYNNLKNTSAIINFDTAGTHNNFSIVFKQDTALNTEQVEAINDTFVSFNKATEKLTIHTSLNLKDISDFSIYNTIGQKVITYKTLDENNTLDISNLSNGIYILNLKSNNDKISVKFSKH